MSQGAELLVDGANVAYLELSGDDQPMPGNIISVRDVLMEKGCDPVIIGDASLRHEIDDPRSLEGMIEDEQIRQAPAGADADYFILETADRYDAPVVSDDDLDHYQGEYEWLDQWRVPLMIIDGEVELCKLDEVE